MEFHRNTGKMLRTALLLVLLGVVLFAFPALLNLIGYEFTLGPWIAYAMGAILAFFGIARIYQIIRYPFLLVVDEAGLSIRCDGLNADVPWAALAEVSIERAHFVDPSSAPYLIIWPVPGAELGFKCGYRRKGDDRPGCLVIQIDELREAPAQVAAVLQAYAGGRFNARDLPASAG
ncbi:hypothetical protein KZ829_40560 [Actinoplanes hulinensis]|uniref:PH domain-containing protein n=1 Tax=Actinoplanes hulinensis TaxID=1144547 RepID=A0ABS7BGL8_9ACTN|nr:hypothetical protein [Actinoplanes hulinensis]MBW6440035.1 hypothetical protein [Actinoplanes hulinensis]